MSWKARIRRYAAVVVSAGIAGALTTWPGAATAESGKIELFQVNALSEGGRIAPGPDGNMWFTLRRARKIGRITPAGQVAEYPLPFPDTNPQLITAGPDGSMWFTVEAAMKGAVKGVARIDVGGNFTEPFASTQGISSEGAGGIVTGPDGAAWLTFGRANTVGRLSPDGQLTEFPVPTPASGVSEIAVGLDGNLWFVETSAKKVSRIAPSGAVTELPLPSSREGPRDIVSSPDGNLWVAEYGRNALARVGVDGQIAEFPIPVLASGGPDAIAADRYGSLWFTGRDTSLMRMTPGGVVTEYTMPNKPKCSRREPCGRGADPIDLAAGPDGSVWFLASGSPLGTTIGKIDPDALPPIPAASVRPSLRGRPMIGRRIVARLGSWSNHPAGYEFEWQVCDRQGLNCRRRRGGGQSIVLTRVEIGRTVRAVVGAENDAGAAFVSTRPTPIVQKTPPPLTVEIDSDRARVRPRGETKLLLSCEDGPPGGYCAGRVLIGLTKKRRGGLGWARYRVASGNSKLVSIPLKERASVLLSRAPSGKRRVLVTATLWGGRATARKLTLSR